MPSYTINRVSEQQPREWTNPLGGVIYYIKVMLEGHDRPVEVGKKKPDALSAGQTINGNILSKPEFEADGFKADPITPHSGGGTGGGHYQRDDNAIKAQFAIKAGIAFAAASGKAPTIKDVQTYAIEFYGMVEEVKELGGSLHNLTSGGSHEPDPGVF
jgi:hypothetical protein